MNKILSIFVKIISKYVEYKDLKNITIITDHDQKNNFPKGQN